MTSGGDGWLLAGNLPKPDVDPKNVGFITTKEKNGIVKLTGMDGPNNKGKIRGLLEIVKTGKPIWGAMDKDFTVHLKKAGFSSPPLAAMKILLPIIQNDPQFSSGGTWENLSPDGAINFQMDMGGGETKSFQKYFTANKIFYRMMLQKNGPKMGLTSEMLEMVKNWTTLPPIAKQMAAPMLKAKGIDDETMNWLAEVMSDETTTAAPEKTAAAQPQAVGAQPTGAGQVGGLGKLLQNPQFGAMASKAMQHPEFGAMASKFLKGFGH
jgi:hypothetical protein